VYVLSERAVLCCAYLPVTAPCCHVHILESNVQSTNWLLMKAVAHVSTRLPRQNHGSACRLCMSTTYLCSSSSRNSNFQLSHLLLYVITPWKWHKQIVQQTCAFCCLHNCIVNYCASPLRPSCLQPPTPNTRCEWQSQAWRATPSADHSTSAATASHKHISLQHQHMLIMAWTDWTSACIDSELSALHVTGWSGGPQV
jgi:hypothetical protein